MIPSFDGTVRISSNTLAQVREWIARERIVRFDLYRSLNGKRYVGYYDPSARTMVAVSVDQQDVQILRDLSFHEHSRIHSPPRTTECQDE